MQVAASCYGGFETALQRIDSGGSELKRKKPQKYSICKPCNIYIKIQEFTPLYVGLSHKISIKYTNIYNNWQIMKKFKVGELFLHGFISKHRMYIIYTCSSLLRHVAQTFKYSIWMLCCKLSMDTWPQVLRAQSERLSSTAVYFFFLRDLRSKVVPEMSFLLQSSISEEWAEHFVTLHSS